MFKCGGKVPEALPRGLESSRIEAHLRRAFWEGKGGRVSPWDLLGSLASRGYPVPPVSPAGWGACVCAVELGIRKRDRLILR